MDTNNQDLIEDELEEVVSQEDETTNGEDELSTLKSRLTELENENTKFKRIAQQKERKLQQAKESSPTTQTSNSALSPRDLIALSRSGYDDEVLEEALEYARFKKIEIKDALNSSFIKAIANEKEEYKRTADATSTKSSRASSKGRDESILSNADRGVMPDSDAEIERLALLRMKKR